MNFHTRVTFALDSPGPGSIYVIDVGDVPNPDGDPTNPLRSFSDVRQGDALRIFSSDASGGVFKGVLVASAPPAMVPSASLVAQVRLLPGFLLHFACYVCALFYPVSFYIPHVMFPLIPMYNEPQLKLLSPMRMSCFLSRPSLLSQASTPSRLTPQVSPCGSFLTRLLLLW